MSTDTLALYFTTCSKDYHLYCRISIDRKSKLYFTPLNTVKILSVFLLYIFRKFRTNLVRNQIIKLIAGLFKCFDINSLLHLSADYLAEIGQVVVVGAPGGVHDSHGSRDIFHRLQPAAGGSQAPGRRSDYTETIV